MDLSQGPNLPKITKNDQFLSIKLLEQLIKETDIPKEMIEEENSELWFETLTGKGKLYFENNIHYIGNVKFGLFESGNPGEIAEISFTDGTKYEGEVHNNQLTGKGTFYFPTGATYSGEVLNGLRNGYGVYNSPNGIKYEGNWKNGLKNGSGVLIKGNLQYEGEWKDGYMEGNGKIIWESGNIYEGEFKNNHINGYGYMIWNTIHEKYTGQWVNDKQEGIGIQTWYQPRGEQRYLYNRYVGEWKEGKRHGYGVFFYSNGTKYEGTWYNNLKEGFGIFTYQDGTQYIGPFEKDQMINGGESLSLEEIEKALSKENFGKNSTSKNKLSLNNVNKNKNSPTKKASLKNFIDYSNSGAKNQKKNGINKNLEMISEQNEIDSQNKGNKIVSPSNNSTKVENVKSNNNSNTNSKKQIQENLKNKNLNKFQPYLSYPDLICLNQEIAKSKLEIENLFLRNFTEIRRWYLNSSKIENYETEEQKEKKDKEYQIPPQCINSNNVSFCMNMKDLWRFFRDVGLSGPDFTFAEFNRLYFNEKINEFEMFFIPEEYENTELYEYLINSVNDAKNNFANKHKKYLDYYVSLPNNYDKASENYQYLLKICSTPPINLLEKGSILSTIINAINSQLSEEAMAVTQTKNRLHFDIHNKHQVVLLRHFYSALIRAAYLKFMFDDCPFEQKVKNVLNMCNISKPQFKRGRGNKSAQSRLESSFIAKENQQIYEQQKKRNSEYQLLDDFSNENESRLKPIFLHLYMKSHKGKRFNFNDMTVTFDYFYKKIIKRSPLLRSLYQTKIQFVEVINYFHKDKKFLSDNTIEYDKEEIRVYVENLMEQEFIYYEFIEIVFFISRKYIMRKRLKEDKQNYLDLINHIWQLIKVDPLKKNEQTLKGKFAYFYPKLEQHRIIERLNDIKRNEEELKRQKQLEVDRYMRERAAMDSEKDNAFIEEKKDEDEYSDESDI